MIEPIKSGEINAIIDMHYDAFKGQLTSDLGKNYIAYLFTGIMNSECGICYGYKIDSKIVGFACGASDLKKLWNIRFKMKLAKFAIIGVMKKPFIIPKIVKYLWVHYQVGKIGINAHMLSIVVLNDYRTKGIGLELVNYFSNFIREQGLKSYLIPYTDASTPISKFYFKIGFKLVKTIKFFNRKDNCFRYDLFKK